MHLTVFGATGGIGGHIVRQALDAGHAVTAVVRDATRFAGRHERLQVRAVPGLHDGVALAPLVEGADAVLSGVGPRSNRDGPVATPATRGILAAMAAAGASRLVVVSAVPVGPVPDGDSLLNRRILLPLVGHFLRNVYRDLGAMEEDIRLSATAWTIMRPPKLVDRPLTGIYRTSIGANVPRGYAVSRANVAHAMLTALADPRAVRQVVGIAD